MKKWIFAMSILFILGFFSSGTYAKNVTQQVMEQTDLDDKIRNGCRIYCRGNRKEGKLTKAVIIKIDSISYRVGIWASLKNHHHIDTLIGGGFSAYQYTVNVHATGILNITTCKLKITDIKVTGDILGIAKGAEKEKGKIYQIDNCHSFI